MVKKCPWTAEEDEALYRLVAEYGQRWSQIAKLMPPKKSKQLRRRWNNVLNADIKNGAWSEREDKILLLQHRLLGNRWTEIAKAVGGRTDNAVKNRWATLSKNGGVPKRQRRKQNHDSSDSEVEQSEPSTSGSDPASAEDRSLPRRTSGRNARRSTWPLQQAITNQHLGQEDWNVAATQGGDSGTAYHHPDDAWQGWDVAPNAQADQENWQGASLLQGSDILDAQVDVGDISWDSEVYPPARHNRLTVTIPPGQDEPSTPPMHMCGFYEGDSEPSSSILVQRDAVGASKAMTAGLPYGQRSRDGEATTFQTLDRAADRCDSDSGVDICQMLHTGVTPQSSDTHTLGRVCKENTPPSSLAHLSPWASGAGVSPSAWGMHHRQPSLLHKVLSRGLDSRGSHSADVPPWGQPVAERQPVVDCSAQLNELPPISQSAGISTPYVHHVAEGPSGAGTMDGQLSSSSQAAFPSSGAQETNSLPKEVPQLNQAAVGNNALRPETCGGAQAAGGFAQVSIASVEASQGLQRVTPAVHFPPLSSASRQHTQMSRAERARGMMSQPMSQAAGTSSTELPGTHHAAVTATQERAASGINPQAGASDIRWPPSSHAAEASAAQKRPRDNGGQEKLQQSVAGAPPQGHATEPTLSAHTANKRPRAEAAGQDPAMAMSGSQAQQPLRRYERRGKKNDEGLDVSKDACDGLPPWLHGPSAAPQHMKQRIEVQEEAWHLQLPLPLWRPECPLGWFPL